MEYEKYNPQGYRKHRHGKLFIFLSFLFVLGIIFFTSFYKGGIAGNIIGPLNQSNLMEIKAFLSVPEVVLEGEYGEIVLSLKKDSFIYLDDKKIDLDQFENKIIIRDFKGNIEVNEINISRLEGKISEIKINNFPIYSQEDKKLKFSLSPGAIHNSFEIKNDALLRDISFVTTGRVSFGGDSLNLNSEKIRFINYLGDLKIEDKKLILQGNIETLKIDSESRKITFSS